MGSRVNHVLTCNPAVSSVKEKAIGTASVATAKGRGLEILAAWRRLTTRPVHNLADHRFDLVASAGLVLAGHGFHETLSLMIGHQVDGRAAEAAA